MNKLQAFIIGLLIAFIFTTFYFAFPPFRIFMVDGATWFAVNAYAFTLVNWLGMLVGGGIVAFFAVAGHRIWVGIKSFGFKQTVKPMQSTLPNPAPLQFSQTPMTQPIPATQMAIEKKE